MVTDINFIKALFLNKYSRYTKCDVAVFSFQKLLTGNYPYTDFITESGLTANSGISCLFGQLQLSFTNGSYIHQHDFEVLDMSGMQSFEFVQNNTFASIGAAEVRDIIKTKICKVDNIEIAKLDYTKTGPGGVNINFIGFKVHMS